MGYVDLLSSDYRVVLTQYREKLAGDVIPEIERMTDPVRQRYAVINVFNFVAGSIWIILERGLVQEKTESMARYEAYVHDRDRAETLDVPYALELTRTMVDELIGLLPTETLPLTSPKNTLTDSEYREAALAEFRRYRATYLGDLPEALVHPDHRDYSRFKCRTNFFSAVYTRVNLLIARGLLPDTFQYFEDYMERDRDWHERATPDDIAMIDRVIDSVITMLESHETLPVS